MSADTVVSLSTDRPALKAIDTPYKGYMFRSRLEARWALFFDVLNIPWEYEKEGYDLEGTFYLPDFWLPNQDCFIEIKGATPSEEDYRKISLLAEHSGKDVHVFVGGIPYVSSSDWWGEFGYRDGFSFEVFRGMGGWDNPYLFCKCHFCGVYDLQFDGRSARINCCDANRRFRATGLNPDGSDGGHEDKAYSAAHPDLVRAYAMARAARFEHGVIHDLRKR